MNSVPLVYDEFGAGEPLLILHGLFGSARNWQGYAKDLAAHYRVITVDLRNHGRSPQAAFHGYGDLAADVIALLDRLNLADVILLGHSMGGKTAMTLALTAPLRVRKLIVVDIAPVAYADEHTATIDAMLALPLSEIMRRQDADRCLAATIPDASIRLFLLQNLLVDDTGTRWRLNLPTLRQEMPKLIGALPIANNHQYLGQVHFIRGEKSDRVLPAYHPQIAHYFPTFTLHPVLDAGHWPHAEAPAAFKVALDAALNT